MDIIEQHVADQISKALKSKAPALSAFDNAKIDKAAANFVTTAMDLAAVYFALRAARDPEADAR